MKKVKRLIALTLVVVMVSALLTGCGSSPSKGGSKDEKGKLTIFQSKTEIMDKLMKCAEDFSKETGIDVEVWETTGDNYYTDLKTDMSTGAGPTLFSLAPGSESKEMADYLEDLGDLSFVSSISKGMADVIDGKIVGIPYTLEGFGLVYNADLVDVSKLTSKDALISYLKEAKDKGINGLGFSQEDYFLIMHVLNTPFAIQDDPDEYLQQVLNGEVRMADNEAFMEFAEVMEAVRDYCKNPVDITYDNNCGDFATGKTAMIHQGNWCYSMFDDYDIEFNMGLTALPICGNNKIAVSAPAAWYINTDAPEEDKEAAKEFLEWLYTSEKGKTYLMDEFGFIPVVSGMTSDKLDPISESVSKAAAQGNTIPWSMSNWPAGIATSLSPIAQEFFTSNMTGEEFINQLNDAFVKAAK